MDRGYILISVELVPPSPDPVVDGPLHMSPTLVLCDLPFVLSARNKSEKLAGKLFPGTFQINSGKVGNWA